MPSSSLSLSSPQAARGDALEDLNEVIMEGVLRKRRSGGNKVVDNFYPPSSWTQRWFRLKKSGLLEYFEWFSDSNGSNLQNGDIRGQLILREQQGINRSIVFGEPIQEVDNTITITQGQEKWKMFADNAQDLLRWQTAFASIGISYRLYSAPNGDKDRSMSPTGGGGARSFDYSPEKQSSASRSNSDYGGNSPNSKSRVESPSGAKTGSDNSSNSDNKNSSSGTSGGGDTAAGRPSNGNSNGNNASSNAAFPASTAVDAVGAANANGNVDKKPATVVKKNQGKKLLSVAGQNVDPNAGKRFYEIVFVIVIINFCMFMIVGTEKKVMKTIYYGVSNFVVASTLYFISKRSDSASSEALAKAKEAEKTALAALEKVDALLKSASQGMVIDSKSASLASSSSQVTSVVELASFSENATPGIDPVSGKPIAGATLTQVEDKLLSTGEREYQNQLTCPTHTWSRCNHKLFNVRVGPNYKKYGNKAPSAAPLYEAFAVDIFCSSKRIDHAAQRFKMPEEYLNVQTGHPHVPPVLIVQMQLPSEAPDMFGKAVEDGEGWAILMYYKISEDTLNQLKDLKTASPAVKLFAIWAEKAKDDPPGGPWRSRFKVIASCLNIQDLNIPSSAAGYNAKPVLIRRTGSIFKADRYMEIDVHIHKFDRFAKTGIHAITKDCGKAFMQIGFVVEGREETEDNMELPETLFACVGVNRPQEDQADFIFE